MGGAGAAAPTADWLAEQGESLNAAQKKLVADTCSYVSANPLKSVAIAAVAAAALADLRHGQPQEERHDREEVGDRRQVVTGVGDRSGHVFASDTSHTASIVKPSITPSIQIWETDALRLELGDEDGGATVTDSSGHARGS